MSIDRRPRRAEAPREAWIGLDAASHTGVGEVWIAFDPASAQRGAERLFFVEDYLEEVREATLAAEARHTGKLIAIGLPAGFLIAWLVDFVTGGPGLAAMVGL